MAFPSIGVVRLFLVFDFPARICVKSIYKLREMCG